MGGTFEQFVWHCQVVGFPKCLKRMAEVESMADVGRMRVQGIGVERETVGLECEVLVHQPQHIQLDSVPGCGVLLMEQVYTIRVCRLRCNLIGSYHEMRPSADV